MSNNAQLLEDSLLVVWNDRNAENRLASMKKIYAPDINFFESNTGEAIIGFQPLNELISRLQAEWPIEFQFELNKPSQVNHHVQVVSWNLGPQGSSPVATGVDVAVVENDLIKSLYLFLDVSENK
jgi:hypothetical protein